MYEDILESDASDMIWALMGTAMHTILERGGINTMGMTEERLYTDIDGVRISGQFDYMDADGTLWDWKLASVWEVMNGVKESREQQLNAYAYLASRNDLNATGLRVGFILRDWSASEYARVGAAGGYPPHQVFTHSVPLWSTEQAGSFLKERIQLHREAAVALPQCSKEDRWANDDRYAVVKSNAKRATRVFADKDDADSFVSDKGTDYRVELRPATSIRCESYCSVSDYCEQWRELRRK